MLRPYMWIRCTYMPVRCSHYINISISAALSRVLIGGRFSAAFLFIALEHLPLIEGGGLSSRRKWLHPTVTVTTGNTLPRGLVPTVSSSAKDIDSPARTCSEWSSRGFLAGEAPQMIFPAQLHQAQRNHMAEYVRMQNMTNWYKLNQKNLNECDD